MTTVELAQTPPVLTNQERRALRQHLERYLSGEPVGPIRICREGLPETPKAVAEVSCIVPWKHEERKSPMKSLYSRFILWSIKKVVDAAVREALIREKQPGGLLFDPCSDPSTERFSQLLREGIQKGIRELHKTDSAEI